MGRGVADLINDIYETPPSGQAWNALLEEIADFVGGEIASLLIVQPRLQSANIVSPRSDPRFIETYFKSWMHRDPTFRYTVSAPVGRVQELTENQREAMHASAFFHDFWKANGQGEERLRTNIVADTDTMIGFSVHREAQHDTISAAMRERYLTLLPHIRRSIAMQHELQQLQMRAHATSAGEGLIALDARARMISCDAQAEEVAARNGWAIAPGGVLRGRSRQSGQQVMAAIRSCWKRQGACDTRGEALTLTGPGDAMLRLRIGPPPGEVPRFVADFSDSGQIVAIALIEDVRHQRETLARNIGERFDLTPAESAVALASLSGAARKDVAASLGLSESTVRTHLTRIYEKTGTRRQAQLVRMLHGEGFGPPVA